jgi:hypothetical protein
MKILKKYSKKPGNLWKNVDSDKYQVNSIYFIIYYKKYDLIVIIFILIIIQSGMLWFLLLIQLTQKS